MSDKLTHSGVSQEDLDKATAKGHVMIVAYQGCTSVNPDHPLVVARALPELVAVLKKMDSLIDDVQFESHIWRGLLREEALIARALLARIEGQP